MRFSDVRCSACGACMRITLDCVMVSDDDAGMSQHHAVEAAIARYLAHAKQQGRSERYLAQVGALLGRVSRAAGWITLDQVTGASLEDYLVGGGFGAKTRNNILCACRAWGRWLVRRKELATNPFAGIELARHDSGPGSRALSPVEMAAMIAVAEADEALPEDQRRSSYIRSPWYKLAAATGLRALEMQRLRVRDVCLDAGRETITLPAATAKARKVQHVPLAESVVPFVASLIAGKQPDDRLIGSSRPRSWVVAGDAKAANIARRHETVGLHSFRKGFVTALAAAGAPMSVTQRLARHSDPRLTQAVYVEANLLPLREAVNHAVTTGYEIVTKNELKAAENADSLPQSQHHMETNNHISSPSGVAQAAHGAVTSPESGGAAPDLLGVSFVSSCGEYSLGSAIHWARQDSNLWRSLADACAAAADLFRRLAAP